MQTKVTSMFCQVAKAATNFSRLRTLADAVPNLRWAIHATDSPIDTVLQFYVTTEKERVSLRTALELGLPDEEGDAYETHRLSGMSLSIIEDVNDVRSSEGEGTQGEN